MKIRTNTILRNRYIALAVALLLLTPSLGCSKGNVKAATPAMPAPLVTVIKPSVQDVPRYLNEIGKNAAFESVTVTPQVAGRVIERHFRDGDALYKGQLLFVIDPRPYQAEVDSAQALLAQAKAALEHDRIQFRRYADVIETRAVSRADYDTKKNAVDVGQAKVEAAEAGLTTAKLNLEYCYIHSPIEGRAGARLVDVGNVVQANSTPLLSIQRIDPIYATFTVTERDLPQVQQGLAKGMLKAAVRLPSDLENAARDGRVEFLDNSVQSGSGTVTLRTTVANADHHFWPGQLINVRLVLANEKAAVLVPSQATQISQEGPFVLVVKSDDTAEFRPVKLGQQQGDQVVVTAGIVADERVVLTGQMLVRPGIKVRVDSGAPGPSALNASNKMKGEGQ